MTALVLRHSTGAANTAGQARFCGKFRAKLQW
jgi:hypothetical protein